MLVLLCWPPPSRPQYSQFRISFGQSDCKDPVTAAVCRTGDIVRSEHLPKTFTYSKLYSAYRFTFNASTASPPTSSAARLGKESDFNIDNMTEKRAPSSSNLMEVGLV